MHYAVNSADPPARPLGRRRPGARQRAPLRVRRRHARQGRRRQHRGRHPPPADRRARGALRVDGLPARRHHRPVHRPAARRPLRHPRRVLRADGDGDRRRGVAAAGSSRPTPSTSWPAPAPPRSASPTPTARAPPTRRPPTTPPPSTRAPPPRPTAADAATAPPRRRARLRCRPPAGVARPLAVAGRRPCSLGLALSEPPARGELTARRRAAQLAATRLGRATSSPPQLGHTDDISSAHATQNVHSKLQIRASPASSSAGLAPLAGRPHLEHGRTVPAARLAVRPVLAGTVGDLASAHGQG